MVLGVIALLIVAVAISALVSVGLGLDDDGMQYDCLKERWVFVPSRYDVMLEMIIKS